MDYKISVSAKLLNLLYFNSSDDRVVTAFISGAVDWVRFRVESNQ